MANGTEKISMAPGGLAELVSGGFTPPARSTMGCPWCLYLHSRACSRAPLHMTPFGGFCAHSPRMGAGDRVWCRVEVRRQCPKTNHCRSFVSRCLCVCVSLVTSFGIKQARSQARVCAPGVGAEVCFRIFWVFMGFPRSVTVPPGTREVLPRVQAGFAQTVQYEKE